jgi:uncharacterized protein YndB with AHSA1/START domain
MSADRDLTLTRDIPVPPDRLYRCWTEPALLVRWFAPRPWTTPRAELDVRPGGSSTIVLRGPDGQEAAHRGVYLAVEPSRRLVSTDAYVHAWQPSGKPFMTLDLTFEDRGDGSTRYTAVARHWTAEDRATHEAMGFHAGWGIATDQLAALAATL